MDWDFGLTPTHECGSEHVIYLRGSDCNHQTAAMRDLVAGSGLEWLPTAASFAEAILDDAVAFAALTDLNDDVRRGGGRGRQGWGFPHLYSSKGLIDFTDQIIPGKG